MSEYVPGDLDWRTSRACDGGACVRVAQYGGSVFVGDTKSPRGPVIEFTMDEWQQFLAGAKLGDFD